MKFKSLVGVLGWNFLIIVVIVLMFFSFGCSRGFKSEGTNFQQSLETTNGAQSVPDGVPQVPPNPQTSPQTPPNWVDWTSPQKPALMNYLELYQSFLSMTGTEISNSINLAELKRRANMFDPDGKLENFNPPMLIAATNLASRFCRTLVTQEKSIASVSRRIYVGFDFARGPSSITPEALDKSIRRMTRSTWGRDESIEEKNIIHDEMIGFVNDLSAAGKISTVQTENYATALCTSILSAFESLTL